MDSSSAAPLATLRVDGDRDAFEALRSEIEAIPEGQAVPPNVDVLRLHGAIVARFERLRSFRGAIAQKAPDFPLRWVDDLERYANALRYAHFRALGGGMPARTLGDDAREVAAIRARWLLEVRVLISRRLLAPTILSALRRRSGHRHAALDVLALAQLFRREAVTLGPRLRLTDAEIDSACVLAAGVFQATAVRDASRGKRSPATLARDRAFTLLARVYGQIRRVISYLRWDEGDADVIVPPLARQTRRRRRREPAATTDDPPRSEIVAAPANDETAPPMASGESANPPAVVALRIGLQVHGRTDALAALASAHLVRLLAGGSMVEESSAASPASSPASSSELSSELSSGMWSDASPARDAKG